jgi:nickel transport protein
MRHSVKSLLATFGYCFVFFASLTFSSISAAHALKVFAYFEGNIVKGSVYFVGGAPAKQALVRLESEDGQPLQQLETDEQGGFISQGVSEVSVTVVADSRDGHIGKWQVTKPVDSQKADSLRSSEKSAGYSLISNSLNSNSLNTNPINHRALDDIPVETIVLENSVLENKRGLSAEELEALVERAVASQVAPLREELHRYQNSARLSDILGGLGVIFGLAGAALWWKARK